MYRYCNGSICPEPHHRQMHAKAACGYCTEPERRSAARTTFASTGIVERWPGPRFRMWRISPASLCPPTGVLESPGEAWRGLERPEDAAGALELLELWEL
ncbi:hypothetical protein V8C35DRAFT_290926 [Trichoderma chlorosporum]